MYSPSFISVHKRLAPAIPIGRFASYINPQAIGFNSEKDFYAPVQFSVQVADGVTGALRIHVATQKNVDWLSDLKTQLGETLGAGVSQSETLPIDLKTITGMSLDRVPVSQLYNVGKLNVYNAKTGELIRLKELPPVPVEYRVTKVADLHEWTQKLNNSIPEAVAATLKGMDNHEVEEALRIDGAVQKEIEVRLKAAGFQPNFVRLHQSSSSKTPITEEESEKLLRKVSKQILTYVRSFVGAANEQVKLHIATEQSKKAKPSSLAKEDEHFFKPVLSAVFHTPAREGEKHSPNLYQTLVEDALSVPTLKKSLVAAIYNYDSSPHVGKNPIISLARPPMKRMIRPTGTNHHPMNAHIHHTLLPLRGTYPVDYIVRHTRQDMSAKAPFVGDATKVYEAYHKFSGVHAAPPPLRIKGGIAIAPAIAPTKKGPKLIPIDSFVDVSFSSGGGKTLPKLTPIESTFSNVACHSKSKYVSSDSSGSESDDDDIGSAMPELIPIDSSFPSYGMERRLPKLIPISDDIDALAVEDKYAHLPSVDDVFK